MMTGNGSPGDTSPDDGRKDQSLDDMMLAMDVIDTLRHQEDAAQRVIDQDKRDEQLKARLRSIYADQGIPVPDYILQQGIETLRQDQFVYRPTPFGLSRLLALLWVKRIEPPIRNAYIVTTCIVILVVYLATSYDKDRLKQTPAEMAAPTAAIPKVVVTAPKPSAPSPLVKNKLAALSPIDRLAQELSEAGSAALSEAMDDEARARVQQVQEDGAKALAQSDEALAKLTLAELKMIGSILEAELKLIIVSRPDEYTGFYRIPDDNPDARNYYIVVEPELSTGKKVLFSILSEETGKTRRVSMWAARVPKATYDKIGMDKADDGIVQNNVMAVKPKGTFKFNKKMDILDGRITEW